MKLIAGLGNPGKKYSKNRHNLGFLILEAFAFSYGLSWKFSPDWLCYFVKTTDYVLVKPNTFMNKSGEAVRIVSNYFDIKSDDILVVHDDLDIPFGKTRLVFNGLSAGHKGVESAIESLGTVGFGRVRVGIGRPSLKASTDAKALADRSDGKLPLNTTDPAGYVLEDFSKDEEEELPLIVKKCIETIKSYLDDGIEATMNKFN
jgi:PTH1 family peptidyl-tRNA hydrolase